MANPHSSPSAIPLRLDFRPSEKRKIQQLNRIDKGRLREHSLPHRRGQSLPEYLHLANNDNIYPSTVSVEHIAPVANDTSNADLEANATGSLLPHDQHPNARPQCFRNIFEECIFVFTVMMATASTTFIQGVIVINTALIGESLKMTASQITWISAAVGYVNCIQYTALANLRADLQVDPSCSFLVRLQTSLGAKLNSVMAWLSSVSSPSLPSGRLTQ